MEEKLKIIEQKSISESQSSFDIISELTDRDAKILSLESEKNLLMQKIENDGRNAEAREISLQREISALKQKIQGLEL